MEPSDVSAAGQTRLGKYRIVGELGRGGFATVFRAVDTSLGREVALKVLHPALLADPDFVARFEQDASAAARLDSPHIATVYELGQCDGRFYIAQLLLPGGTLAERVAARGPLPFGEAARIVAEVAEALDTAHAAGMIHRDVKPANILFNARGEAVLTDFGLVRAAQGRTVGPTTASAILGTPAYLAPEIWDGQPATPAVDVYALGCVAFELLTGRALFTGETPPAVMRAHFASPRFPAAWPAGAPRGVAEVLRRALSPDPAARYPSAGALAAALGALAGKEPAPRPGTPDGAAASATSAPPLLPSVAAAASQAVSASAAKAGARVAPSRRGWRGLAAITLGWALGGALLAIQIGQDAWFKQAPPPGIDRFFHFAPVYIPAGVAFGLGMFLGLRWILPRLTPLWLALGCLGGVIAGIGPPLLDNTIRGFPVPLEDRSLGGLPFWTLVTPVALLWGLCVYRAQPSCGRSGVLVVMAAWLLGAWMHWQLGYHFFLPTPIVPSDTLQLIFTHAIWGLIGGGAMLVLVMLRRPKE